MVVTLTYLRLRSLLGFFQLSWWGFKITLQARKQKGFLKMKNTGFGYKHYTASVWQSEADAKAFARSGAHLLAMKQSAVLATEIRIFTFPGSEIPPWAEAKKIVEEKGRHYTY